jgi:Lon protease-like protein
MMRIPVFPLGIVLLPRMPLPLHIFEERYREMFAECIREELPFGVILNTGSTLQNVGCLARIDDVINRYEDGRLDILTVGTERFHVENLHQSRSYLEADIETFHDEKPDRKTLATVRVLTRTALVGLRAFAETAGYTVDDAFLHDLDHEELSFLLATTGDFSTEEKQELLEMRCTATRMKRASRALEESRHKREMVENVRRVLGKETDEDISHLFN